VSSTSTSSAGSIQYTLSLGGDIDLNAEEYRLHDILGGLLLALVRFEAPSCLKLQLGCAKFHVGITSSQPRRDSLNTLTIERI